MNDAVSRRVLQQFEKATRTYLEVSARFAKGALMVAAARDPALFGDAADQVRLERTTPQITVRAGTVTVELIAATGETVGTVFQYSAPADNHKAR